ncbi:hypothetical protein OJ997_00650 [Solirubrobacter phytolaccae]|uniref:Phospholipase n=1 Tax=Solirubrobacter phytolaccae TaxID=1404360 RepID=A0A9X3SC72_9ACTN|nr:hypothetical protein [Solirubrobacter phytolaccae]MDA0178787.1 hypothetical protein [Solirubrobacter phytolaccae]
MAPRTREAVVTAELGDLLSEAGVSIKLGKTDRHVVVVAEAPCCSHAGGRAVSGRAGAVASGGDGPVFQPAFNTAEHAIIVSGLTLQTEAARVDAATTALPMAQVAVSGCSPTQDVPATYSLTYGQLIALGGDFYGDPAHPVCSAPDPVCQFARNFNGMGGAQAEVQAILAVAQKFEFGPISSAVRDGHQPSGVYAGLGTSAGHVVPDEDRAFDKATGGTTFRNGRYLNLASTNFDHFGVDAIAAYTAGHRLAQQTAAAAKAIDDPGSRAQALLTAYAINAFSDHFLTDLFASGHMRTPRRKLYESADTDLTRMGASLCAKQMHDEDNKFGLWVTNSVGDRWVAYGDSRYRDTYNAAGRVIAKRAVQQSMDDVWDSFAAGGVTDTDALGVLKYVARLVREVAAEPTADQHRDDPNNWSPLFWWDPSSNMVMRRNALLDPSDRTFCKQGLSPWTWGITSTVAKMKGSPIRMPKRMYSTYPPDETGPNGELGWPPLPGTEDGPTGAAGPTLTETPFTWAVDGSPGV